MREKSIFHNLGGTMKGWMKLTLYVIIALLITAFAMFLVWALQLNPLQATIMNRPTPGPTPVVVVVLIQDGAKETTGKTGVPEGCPSLTKARQLFEVEVTLLGQEACAYTFNSGDGRFIPVKLPQGWYATTAEEDGLVYVQEGVGDYVKAKAATWRWKSAYPDLTLEMQFKLTVDYAALPQNQFANSVRCRGCVGFSDTPSQPTAAPAGTTCPNVTGFSSSSIKGGCVYKSTTPSTFTIPSGWKAYYGQPAQWVESGSIQNVTQVSLYPK